MHARPDRRCLVLLGQTGRDLWAANALEWAAAVAFYAMLSLFPLLLAGAVIASTVVDPAWATERVATSWVSSCHGARSRWRRSSRMRSPSGAGSG